MLEGYGRPAGNLAIIPARGGSKRIPCKNIRLFSGKPIIAYSIQAALDSGLFESVIVTTDDDEIAEVARAHGAQVPFMRPEELANDHAPLMPVIKHGVEAMQAVGMDVKRVCCILATSPFVVPGDLERGLAALSDAPAAFSVTTFAYPIFRALAVNDKGYLEMIKPEYRETRSQDLPEAFHDAGQFYWATSEFWTTAGGFMDGQAIGVPLPRHRVQDIDEPEDWLRAEAMYRVLVEMKEI